MKQRGIIMRDWEVCAIREGRKTQKRFIMKPQPKPWVFNSRGGYVASKFSSGAVPWMEVGGIYQDKWELPYGQPGDLLRVKEAHWVDKREASLVVMDLDGFVVSQNGVETGQKALTSDLAGNRFWKRRSPAQMPHWASRITLEIVSVRAQRLHDITEEDARAEGITKWGDYFKVEAVDHPHLCARDAYCGLWESIHSPGSWERNDFVFAVEFKEVKP